MTYIDLADELDVMRMAQALRKLSDQEIGDRPTRRVAYLKAVAASSSHRIFQAELDARARRYHDLWRDSICKESL